MWTLLSSPLPLFPRLPPLGFPPLVVIIDPLSLIPSPPFFLPSPSHIFSSVSPISSSLDIGPLSPSFTASLLSSNAAPQAPHDDLRVYVLVFAIPFFFFFPVIEFFSSFHAFTLSIAFELIQWPHVEVVQVLGKRL